MTRIFIIFIFLFLIGALFIISNNNLQMYKQENLPKFSGMYLNWLKELVSNFSGITGYIVKMNWIP